MPTNIAWTEETWNPIAGCSKISPGCKFCYAIKDATRLSGNTNPKIAAKYAGTVKDGNWTGKINKADFDVLTEPLRWTKPRKIFVNSMSDLFHPNVPRQWIDEVIAVIALADSHIFQLLTKRADRMRDYFNDASLPFRLYDVIEHILDNFIKNDFKFAKLMHRLETEGFFKKNDAGHFYVQFPLKNLWIGTSVEDQPTADERIPFLLQIPAVVRWLSIEPLLGAINLRFCDEEDLRENDEESYPVSCEPCHTGKHWEWMFQPQICEGALHWIVLGGESGTNARWCNLDNMLSIIEQADAARVPVFVKQLGAVAYIPRRDESFFNRFQIRGENTFFVSTHDKGGDFNSFPKILQRRDYPVEFSEKEAANAA